MIFYADWREQWICIPDPGATRKWRRVVDTSLPAGEDFLADSHELPLEPSDRHIVPARSSVVLLAKA